jgi:hypothetical protein
MLAMPPKAKPPQDIDTHAYHPLSREPTDWQPEAVPDAENRKRMAESNGDRKQNSSPIRSL